MGKALSAKHLCGSSFPGPRFLSKRRMSWTPHLHMDVKQWLKSLDLLQYAGLFIKYKGVEELLYFSEAEIKAMGVTIGSHRAKIMSSLVYLKRKYEKSKGNEDLADRILLSGVGRPSSCVELQLMGYTKSGVYTIYPRSWYNMLPFDVYCDLETDGGGWTVFQRRDDFGEPRENFFRSWSEYSEGFGNLSQEFWLGNDNIYLLTNQDQVTLRIDLADFEGNKTFALYKGFQVGHRRTDYNLSTVGEYTGETASVPGNSFMYLVPGAFVTHDKNDVGNCAKSFKGGWWYTGCHGSNLNGPYLKGKHESYADGINWAGWRGHHYSLKWTEMKVRPMMYSADAKVPIVPQ